MLPTLRRIFRKHLVKLIWSTKLRNAFTIGMSQRGLYMCSDQGDHFLIFDPSEYIGRTIVQSGEFERTMTGDVVKFLRSNSMLEPNGVLLEIGAHIGTQTIYLTSAASFERCLLLEPDPINIRLLRANLRLNGLDGHASLFECAAGDVEAELPLRRRATNSGAATLRRAELVVPDEDDDRWLTERNVCVPVRRVDDLVRENGFHPSAVSLVWMDVEGFELKAMKGMHSIMKEAPPLFFEYSPDWLDHSERLELLDLIFEHYKSVYLYDGQFRQVDSEAALVITKQVNLLCL